MRNKDKSFTQTRGEPASSSKCGRPARRAPAKTKKEKAQRAKERRAKQKLKQQLPSSWTCPVPGCGWSTTASYGGVVAGRRYHGKSRRPDLPQELFTTRELQAAAISTSALIPREARDWECPLCKEGLPLLEYQRKKRCIRLHCEERHPGETPRSLFAKSQLNTTKPGTAASLREAHAKARAEKFPSHNLVQVVPHERVLAGNRGYLYYCTKCLQAVSRYGKRKTAGLSCQQFCDRLAESKELQGRRARWWTRLKANQPRHAEALAEAVGKTCQQIDEACFVNSGGSSSEDKLPKTAGRKGGRGVSSGPQPARRRPQHSKAAGRSAPKGSGPARVKARYSVTSSARHVGGVGPSSKLL